MYIARWNFTARMGKIDACLDLLRRWEIDVGQRVGWRAALIRVTRSVIGGTDGEFEFEVRLDSLSDLEGAWADLAQVPYQEKYVQELEAITVAGTSRWCVRRVLELTTPST